jgi:hypothetical protein
MLADLERRVAMAREDVKREEELLSFTVKAIRGEL